MKALLSITVVLEVPFGVALLASPALPASIVLGAPLDTPTGLTFARLAGAAVVALGIACWRALQDGRSRSATGVVAAMLFYNVVVIAILMYARLGLGVGGIVLWPAVVLHAVLAACCIACLRP